MNTNYTFRANTLVNVELLFTPFPESDELYDLAVCHYTKGLITRKDAIVLGAVVPQAPVSYLCHPLSVQARKESVKQFNDSEQNCNTCKHLKRVKFDKAYWKTSGLQPGECFNEHKKPMYQREGNTVLFAPDDCMSQECYASRGN
jgi:hypothetical protein